jgi:hypothetical protein
MKKQPARHHSSEAMNLENKAQERTLEQIALERMAENGL